MDAEEGPGSTGSAARAIAATAAVATQEAAGATSSRDAAAGNDAAGRDHRPPASVVTSSSLASRGAAAVVVCQVPGCGACLSEASRYLRRYRVCADHQKATLVDMGHGPQRFCQQCGRFQPVEDFDGDKRGCRERLSRHNARRRKEPRDASAVAAAAAAAQAAFASISERLSARARLGLPLDSPAKEQLRQQLQAAQQQAASFVAVAACGAEGGRMRAAASSGSGGSGSRKRSAAAAVMSAPAAAPRALNDAGVRSSLPVARRARLDARLPSAAVSGCGGDPRLPGDDSERPSDWTSTSAHVRSPGRCWLGAAQPHAQPQLLLLQQQQQRQPPLACAAPIGGLCGAAYGGVFHRLAMPSVMGGGNDGWSGAGAPGRVGGAWPSGILGAQAGPAFVGSQMLPPSMSACPGAEPHGVAAPASQPMVPHGAAAPAGVLLQPTRLAMERAPSPAMALYGCGDGYGFAGRGFGASDVFSGPGAAAAAAMAVAAAAAIAEEQLLQEMAASLLLPAAGVPPPAARQLPSALPLATSCFPDAFAAGDMAAGAYAGAEHAPPPSLTPPLAPPERCVPDAFVTGDSAEGACVVTARQVPPSVAPPLAPPERCVPDAFVTGDSAAGACVVTVQQPPPSVAPPSSLSHSSEHAPGGFDSWRLDE